MCWFSFYKPARGHHNQSSRSHLYNSHRTGCLFHCQHMRRSRSAAGLNSRLSATRSESLKLHRRAHLQSMKAPHHINAWTRPLKAHHPTIPKKEKSRWLTQIRTEELNFFSSLDHTDFLGRRRVLAFSPLQPAPLAGGWHEPNSPIPQSMELCLFCRNCPDGSK